VFINTKLFVVCCVVVYDVIERKASRTYSHIHLNAVLSSMGGVEMFTKSRAEKVFLNSP